MIISASYRTDIPAFHADWFAQRLAAGVVEVANPYGGPPSTVRLDKDHADGFVFWTRNVSPFLGVLDHLRAEDRPFVVQMTVTGYPRALERSVIEAARGVAQIRELAARYGKRSVVWRYDPVLISEETPADFHRARMGELAGGLSDAVDEVVMSFANPYRKTRNNLKRAGITWRDPEGDEKRALLSDLTAIAHDAGIRPTLCAQPDLLVEGLEGAACIDAARLSDVAGREISARIKGNRPGCLCAESRDIGAYDTCPHGCVYCYAVTSQAAAKRAVLAQDPADARLRPATRSTP